MMPCTIETFRGGSRSLALLLVVVDSKTEVTVLILDTYPVAGSTGRGVCAKTSLVKHVGCRSCRLKPQLDSEVAVAKLNLVVCLLLEICTAGK